MVYDVVNDDAGVEVVVIVSDGVVAVVNVGVVFKPI